MADKNFFTKVQLWREDAVGIIAINNPPLNLIDHDVLEQLASAVALAESDPNVKIVAITGTGPSFFSAGAKWDAGLSEVFLDRAQALASIVSSASKPVAALLNSAALGAGFELALIADFRLGTSTSYMGFPEAKVGYPPILAGEYFAKELLGTLTAKKFFTMGQIVDPSEAAKMGLIDVFFKRDNFFGESKNWLDSIVSRQPNTHAFRLITIDPLKLRYAFEVERTWFNRLIAGGKTLPNSEELRREREEIGGRSPAIRGTLKELADPTKKSSGEPDAAK